MDSGVFLAMLDVREVTGSRPVSSTMKKPRDHMVPGLFTSFSRNLGGECAPTYKKRMRAARNTPSLPASLQREHSVSAGCLAGDDLKTAIKIWQDASAFSAMFRPLEASCSSTRLICRNCPYFHKKEGCSAF